MGDLKLEFDESHAAYDEGTYQRVLDLDTATVKMQYSVNKVEYTREHFASYPDEVIVIKISGNKPSSLNFTVSLDSKLHHHAYTNNDSQIILDGRCLGRRIPPQVFGNSSPKEKEPLGPIQHANPKGVEYFAVLDLQIGDGVGELLVLDGRKLRVVGCNWVVIRLAASSTFDGPFKNPVDSKRDPSLESLSKMEASKRYSYADLYSRHVNDYQELFHRVSLQLPTNAAKGDKDGVIVTTAKRVKSFKIDEDPSLVELLFQYGRYLLIASSRPGSQPANLQGIWNKDIEPAWEYVSCFHIS